MTLRESYIQGLIDLLTGTVGFPAGVERSITRAFTREESPVVIVHRGGEDLENTLGRITDRHCEILVTVLSRSDVPDADADEVMEIAHPLIMGFTAPGVELVQEVGTNAPLFSNANGQACMLTARYKILYSTDRRSLSS